MVWRFLVEVKNEGPSASLQMPGHNAVCTPEIWETRVIKSKLRLIILSLLFLTLLDVHIGIVSNVE